MVLERMICTAVAAENIEQAKKKVEKAIDQGTDLIEIRLDYFKSFSSPELQDLVQNTPKPLIFTIRKKKEGGYFKGSEDERKSLLKMAIESRPKYVDIEISSEFLDEMLELGKQNLVDIICSYHNFEKTPDIEVLMKKISEVKEKGGQIVKTITMATKLSDNLVHFNLLNQIKDLKLISFAMGQMGVLARAFSPIFGGLFTYAAIEEKTAPGQLHISAMKKILDLLELDSSEKPSI